MPGGGTAESVFEATLRDLLASGNAARFRAEGDSMHPVIRGGDYVQVVPCAASELQRGDIILAATARGLTAHRIVRFSRRGIVTRGDNSLRADPPVDAANVLGRIAKIEEITRHSRPLDKSMKIIRLTATFVRQVRKRFQQ